ncbi:hypothetical protein M9458_002697 [Cirrhinus mrigala]|uniref:Reverse transcriptase/retrotransposon-derived protein RNase H-like domain-containing protein n=1 Tax=Cirrhinus mrigala TaxID=683832 RepID=A0ABD0S1K4_CIRMR
MNKVFWEFLHRFVIVYTGILIFSRNLAEHRRHVVQVLQKLREYHLYLKLENCKFHRTTIKFLGYVISLQGIQMDSSKVQAIQDRSSMIIAPLTSMLQNKPTSLYWTPETLKSFDQLKETFCTAPTLVHPDSQQPFIAEVDTFTVGVGVLSQRSGEPPVLYPCAYFSRGLTPAEQNYDIGNRKLLAISGDTGWRSHTSI